MDTEFVYIPFTVRDSEAENAGRCIREFVENIRNNEPGTLLYASLKEKEKPSNFIHFMIFANAESHEKHRNTDYVRAFVEKLYPLCSVEPSPVFMDCVDLCGKASEEIEKAG